MSRKTEVYEFVRNKIIHNQFKTGQVISENQLAKLTGASRTPVREALNELRETGLIVKVGRENVVPPLTEQDVDEIYQLRTLLETFCLKTTISLIKEEELDQFAQGFKKAAADNDWDEYLKVDIAFHKAITSLPHHRRTKYIIDNLQGEIDRTRYLNEQNDHRIPHSLTEHLEIIKMIKARDLSGAENALRYHLQEVYLSAKHYLID